MSDYAIHSKAEKYFGVTDDPSEAGYMTPNGVILDFSGKKFGGHGGTRHMDHSEIGFIFDDDEDITERPKYEYMNRGGIRMSPENNGFECRTKPTSQQYSALRRYLDDTYGAHYIDLYDPDTKKKYSYSYDSDVKSDKIINDMKRFYADKSMDDSQYYESFKFVGYIPLFENFINEEQRFKLTSDKFKEMYDRVYLGIEDNSEEVDVAKNILWGLKSKNYYITKGEYDLIQSVIRNDNAKKGKHYTEYGEDTIPIQNIKIKKFGEPLPSVDPPKVKDEPSFMPVGALNGYWRKMTTTDHRLKQFVDKIFDRIEKRPTVTNKEKICYPVTAREMAVLRDFEAGRLNPRNFPATF